MLQFNKKSPCSETGNIQRGQGASGLYRLCNKTMFVSVFLQNSRKTTFIRAAGKTEEQGIILYPERGIEAERKSATFAIEEIF